MTSPLPELPLCPNHSFKKPLLVHNPRSTLSLMSWPISHKLGPGPYRFAHWLSHFDDLQLPTPCATTLKTVYGPCLSRITRISSSLWGPVLATLCPVSPFSDLFTPGFFILRVLLFSLHSCVGLFGAPGLLKVAAPHLAQCFHSNHLCLGSRRSCPQHCWSLVELATVHAVTDALCRMTLPCPRSLLVSPKHTPSPTHSHTQAHNLCTVLT